MQNQDAKSLPAMPMFKVISKLLKPLGLLLACCAVAFNVMAQGTPQTQLPRITLNAGMHLIQVQVAQDFEQRQIGLMWRKEMPQNEGMLFVFEQASVQCFGCATRSCHSQLLLWPTMARLSIWQT